MSELPSLRELLGDDATLRVVEAYGGTRIQVPKLAVETHKLRETLGAKIFSDLVLFYGGTLLLVPLARHWRVELYARQKPPMTHAEIARKIGCGETMVYRLLKKQREAKLQMHMEF